VTLALQIVPIWGKFESFPRVSAGSFKYLRRVHEAEAELPPPASNGWREKR